MADTDGNIFQEWAGRAVRAIQGNAMATRLLAFLIDYLICGILVTIPSSVAYSLLVGGQLTDLTAFVDAGYGVGTVILVTLASLAVSFAYYVIVPWRVWPGQTLGKRSNGIEVVMVDGSPATLPALAGRWAFMVFVETLSGIASAFLIQCVTLALGQGVGGAYTVAGAVATAISLVYAWQFNADHRCLHDLVSGTWVYNGRISK